MSVNELWEFNTGIFLCLIYLKNLDDQKWTVVATEQTKPRNAHITVLYDNKLYVFGGTSNGTVLNDFFYFNLGFQLFFVVLIVLK